MLSATYTQSLINMCISKSSILSTPLSSIQNHIRAFHCGLPSHCIQINEECLQWQNIIGDTYFLCVYAHRTLSLQHVIQYFYHDRRTGICSTEQNAYALSSS
ncbi:MAG: hypothetical protein DID89_2727547374 [Candidatus Nitrotoga sp. CP45]|nr:MAG: hypothetical protein DID89_2727547374 [Candidatus Nitrotoga sp. CP45]